MKHNHSMFPFLDILQLTSQHESDILGNRPFMVTYCNTQIYNVSAKLRNTVQSCSRHNVVTARHTAARRGSVTPLFKNIYSVTSIFRSSVTVNVPEKADIKKPGSTSAVLPLLPACPFTPGSKNHPIIWSLVRELTHTHTHAHRLAFNSRIFLWVRATTTNVLWGGGYCIASWFTSECTLCNT